MTPRSTNLLGILPKNYRDVQETLQQLNRDHGTSRLYWWSKQHYNKLLPVDNSFPAPRFYGLPKIHKANCPMHPIVSACGTSHIPVGQILDQDPPKLYRDYPNLFVKVSKVFQ